jgi:hypothetical protein
MDETGTLLQILKTVPEGSTLSWGKLNSYMKKAGVPQHDYDSFKQVYDSNPQLQDLVKFDNEGVTVYSNSTDKLPNKKRNPDKGTEKMAKRATNPGD